MHKDKICMQRCANLGKLSGVLLLHQNTKIAYSRKSDSNFKNFITRKEKSLLNLFKKSNLGRKYQLD